MIWQTKTLAHILGNMGCGVTIDGFRAPNEPPTLQWICSIPKSSMTETDESKIYANVMGALSERGFVPKDDQDTTAQLGLSNSFSVEGECPYSPSKCQGEHILMTGNGYFTHK